MSRNKGVCIGGVGDLHVQSVLEQSSVRKANREIARQRHFRQRTVITASRDCVVWLTWHNVVCGYPKDGGTVVSPDGED